MRETQKTGETNGSQESQGTHEIHAAQRIRATLQTQRSKKILAFEVGVVLYFYFTGK